MVIYHNVNLYVVVLFVLFVNLYVIVLCYLYIIVLLSFDYGLHICSLAQSVLGLCVTQDVGRRSLDALVVR